MSRSIPYPSCDAIAWQAFEDAPIGMAIISLGGRFLHVNREYCKFIGYSRRELLGMSVRDVTYRADWKTSLDAVHRLHTGQAAIHRLEKRYVHKSGRVLWGALRVREIMDRSSQRLCTLSQVIDITGQKEAEAALRMSEALFRVALAGTDITVYAHDRDLRYIWAHNLSPDFKMKDLLGKRPSEALDPRTARISTAIKRQVMKSGVGRRDEIICYLSGKTLTYDVTTEPLRDEHGKIAGVICASVNITRRKQMEKELQEAHDKLEQQVKERTARLRALTEELTQTEHRERKRIAQFLHDELQQVFVGAQYSLSTLPEHRLNSTGGQALDQVRRALKKGLTLTRAFSADLRPPVMDIAAWRPILGWIADDAKAKFGLAVKFKAHGAPPIAAVKLRLLAMDALRELLFNVAKHAGVKAAQIRVQAVGTQKVRIEVRDQGRGFDPAVKRERSFGLFSIRERAEAVGGHFAVTRAPVRGMCAALILPLR